MEISISKIRLDRWLWYCRFFKSRTVAARQIRSNNFRVNGARVRKASVPVKLGDIVVFQKNNEVKIVEVMAAGSRRGAPAEAASLYKERDK
ncbi:MAG: S4 domain-containing protein [Pseudomonadota bacterium]|nr:S4 domain-containing protein [Pseudomonadota bacterium]